MFAGRLSTCRAGSRHTHLGGTGCSRADVSAASMAYDSALVNTCNETSMTITITVLLE